MKGKVTEFLDSRLASILNNKPFDVWIEDTVDQIAISKVPINLYDYYEKLRIGKFEIDPRISFNAKIEPNGNHFILTLQRPFNLSASPSDRYIVAHELAHTFQYINKDGVLIDQTHLIAGSFEIEFFCNRLARTLIIPRKLLLPYLRSQPPIDNPKFSLKSFNTLSAEFVTSHKLILQRSILDLEFFGDFILLRFLELKDKGKWGLLERYLSNKFQFNKKYFIPFLNSDTKRPIDLRMPLCGKEVNDFLSFYKHLLSNHEEQSIVIENNELLGRPTGWFFKNYINKSLRVCKISKVISHGRILLNLSISLNSNHITQNV